VAEFTVPALLLIIGLPAGEAVGTAFVFAGVLRLIAAPFYLVDRHVHAATFVCSYGAVPGSFAESSRCASWPEWATVRIIISLGIVLASHRALRSASNQNHGFAVRNARWLPWLAFPIGLESAFIAGAGALGQFSC